MIDHRSRLTTAASKNSGLGPRSPLRSPPCDYLQHWRSYAADRGPRWLAAGDLTSALVSTRCQGLVGRLTCEHGQYIRALQTGDDIYCIYD